MTTTRWTPRPPLFHRDPQRHHEDHELGGHAAWYLVAGGVTTGLQAVLFLVLRPEFGSQWANLVAIALTTVGNTEFHRRVTFAGRASKAGKRHLQDFLTFVFYAGYGSIVLATLDAVVSHPTAWEETASLLAASFVGGVVRFAVLRWWVFAHAKPEAPAADHD
ncbi:MULTISPECIES: GtrA family protein [unclassified Amycolatopsis]|uniref:GtrA family protein n=1 Tax=unclassified Amycolatopsis TaxID=2618356 RepID=UPI00345262E7